MLNLANEYSLDNSRKWLLLNGADTSGKILRSTVAEGVSYTHSTAFASSSAESVFEEEGSIANFVFILEGAFGLKAGRTSRWKELSGGSSYLFYTKDSEIHRKLYSGCKAEAVIIKLSETALGGLLNDTGKSVKKSDPNNIEQFKCFSPYTKYMCSKIISSGYRGLTGKTMIHAWILELLMETFMADGITVNSKDKRTAEEIAAFIKATPETGYSLHELAKSAGMSHTKLCRIFKEVFGISVFTFIRKEKLNLAEKYLKDTDMNITEIAYSTGFSSSSHFCACFCKEKGVPPREYRKKL